MKAKLSLWMVALAFFTWPLSAQPQSQPLRVFIRSGPKTHGPGQHDHPRFLTDWKKLLTDRGMQVDGKLGFPTAAELENTDVLVCYAAENGTIQTGDRANLEKFLKRGGGIVVIHDAVCGTDPQWFKTIIGGAWEHGHSKWYEGPVGFYVIDSEHPITRGLSNFDFKDEIYWDLHMMPDAKVLASSFESVFNIAPQMWVYEKENYRAFVCIPGHEYASFNLPQVRALLLRGIAWTAKLDADKFLNQEELSSLKYPPGGPTAPEKAASKISIPENFTIDLVASEPLIEKVISMDWDEKGRLWIAETPEYPNGRRINKNDEVIAPGRKKESQAYPGGIDPRPATDRISILTDTNGDGRMDKKTVFYTGLELVTSLVLYKDGVIVSQAPDIYWLRDTDGDGKADQKVVLFTGFGTSDTHAVISNMRWGMDGWIYATQGYSGANPKSADGKRDFGKLGSGVLRFKPDGSAIEMVSSKGGNTWGLDLTWDNEIFFTQANGTHLQHVVLPESVLARGRWGSTPSYKTIEDHKKVYPLIKYTRQAYLQIDNVGGFTAAAGSLIYDGGAWPDDFRYSHFVAEPTVNLVHQDLLKRDGTSFIASKPEEKEFIASTDLWFRPIHQRVGPDGAMYVLDFYNQAAVHNDTRGPRHGAGNAAVRPDRDHHFARIWRIQHKQAKKFPQPVLARNDVQGLVQALEHPNSFYRMTAQRLLWEASDANAIPALSKMAVSGTPPARVLALWTLQDMDKITAATLNTAMKDTDPGIRRNGLLIAAERHFPDTLPDSLARLKDDDSRVRLAALVAIGAERPTGTVAQSVVKAYPGLKDPWLQSAAIGAGAQAPLEFLAAALASENPDDLSDFVANLVSQSAPGWDGKQAVAFIVQIANAPAKSARLKQAALENLRASLKPDIKPEWSAELSQSLTKLLDPADESLAGAALPLAAHWDESQKLAPSIAPLISRLLEKLGASNADDEAKGRLVKSLIEVRAADPRILPGMMNILGPDKSPALQRKVLEALGTAPDPSIGVRFAEVYPRLAPDLQTALFSQITKRSEWIGAFLDAIRAGKINLASLNPLSLHRLRTFSDPAIAKKANDIIDEINGPEMKEKDALIAKFVSIVQQKGNPENGHKIFSQNCATCHAFKGEGRDLAPDLSGMGVHGPAELLVHILDPNRVVEPNYIAQSIETKDDQSLDGILARENSTSIILRNAQGDIEIKKANIKSQRSTGLSLMPNGFEALGGEGLRDLLSFIGEGESRYRVLDLTTIFTADSSKGISDGEERSNGALRFKKFGLLKAGEIPFEIASPLKSKTGRNLLVLRGGSGLPKSLPQEVEIPTSIKADRLHFLGGIGAWAWPCCGENKYENLPVAKVTVSYENGTSDEFVLKNGVEFADFVGDYDVPGSKAVPDLITRGQIRAFTRRVKGDLVITKLKFQSYDNAVAPIFAAVTAEIGTAPTSPKPPSSSAQPIRALIVGGGSSHDFNKWFNEADSATLKKGGLADVSYTENLETILPALDKLDVLYLTLNKPIPDEELRKAIFKFVDQGKGLLLVHPALWYNWKDWPEYNQKLVGGGAHSHDKYGEFEVLVTDPKHPIMKGVPPSFHITDELYHYEKDAHGAAIEILATGRNLQTGASYPSVWVTKYPKGRVVCVTLGHDAAAHELEAYKTILTNALKWAAGRP